MRRVLSLIALAGSLVLAASQPLLTLSSIKALDATETNKGQWNFKGQVDDASNDYVLAVGDFGIMAELIDSETSALDIVAFAPEQCKLLSDEKGFTCRIKGARLSFKKAVSKEAKVAGNRENKTSHGGSDREIFTYYKVSGRFHRRDFPMGPQLTPLTVQFSVDGSEIATTNTNCKTKELVGGKTRYHCVPEPITSAPTAAPTSVPTASPTNAPTLER